MDDYLKIQSEGFLMVKLTLNRRALAKTITWRFVATGTTILVAFIFTGSLIISLEIGSVEMILKLLFYYLHERAWDKPKTKPEEISLP
jgi:uncharacterized membrane protein